MAPRRATVDFHSYSTESVANRFDPVGKKLAADLGIAAVNNGQLALLNASLIQMNETTLGRDSSLKKELTKLPMRLFHDYKPNGGVYVILKTYFQLKSEFTFSSFPPHESLRILKAIHQNLISNNLLRFPTVFFSKEIEDGLREELKTIAAGHGATVTENEAEASHIVFNEPEDDKALYGNEYFRVLQLKGKFALVHWFFHPDSYDAWVISNEVDNTQPQRLMAQPGGVRKVTLRWIRDLDLFNEWMNEFDYDVDRPFERHLYNPRSSAVPIAQDDQAVQEPPKKRIKLSENLRPVPVVVALPTHAHNVRPELASMKNAGTQTRDVQLNPDATVLNISNSIPKIDSSSDDATLDEEDVSSAPKSITNSPFATWFSYEAIHPIEKREFPEFFEQKSSSKTPQTYMEYRNFMVQTYEQNPSQYLTQTAARRNLAGDVSTILRIHSFLEHWGLINYRVNADLFPIPFPKFADSLNNKQDYVDNMLRLRSQPSSNVRLNLKKNLYSAKWPIKTCETCAVNCSYSYYANQKQAGYVVCPNCFSSGRYEENMSSADFLKHESDQVELSALWTDVETLRLLEAIQRHPDDWDRVAEIVGTKTKAECLLHFIQMPIEDPFLDNSALPLYTETETPSSTPKPSASESSSSDAAEGSSDPELLPTASGDSSAASGSETEAKAETKTEAEKDTPMGTPSETPAKTIEIPKLNARAEELPFSAASNPVMSLVTFLASSVKPSIAAAAAQAALDVFVKQSTSSSSSSTESAQTNGNGVHAEDSSSSSSSSSSEVKEIDWDIKAAAAAGIGAASVRAKVLAAREEREMFQLMKEIIDLQVQKLELKLKSFENIENKIEADRIETEKKRLEIQQQLVFLSGRRDQFFASQAAATSSSSNATQTQQ